MNTTNSKINGIVQQGKVISAANADTGQLLSGDGNIVQWYVNSILSGQGDTYSLVSTDLGKTVSFKVVDSTGNVLSSSEERTVTQAQAKTDLNQDGRSDLIWQHVDGSVFNMPLDANGSPSLNADGSLAGGLRYGALSSDWSMVDSTIITAQGDHELLFYNKAEKSFFASVGINGQSIGSGYLSGDAYPVGFQDQAMRTTSHTIEMNVNGQLTQLNVQPNLELVASSVDFNRDSNTTDLLWQDSSTYTLNNIDVGHQLNLTGRLFMTLQDANGQVTTTQLAIGEASNLRINNIDYTPESTSDFNGDASNDILLIGADRSVYLSEMNGATILKQGAVSNQAFLGQNHDQLPVGLEIVETRGDFNNDGKTDLLLRNTSGSDVTTADGIVIKSGGLLVDTQVAQGTGLAAGQSVPSSSVVQIQPFNDPTASIPNTYEIVSAHNDFNGDGKADILFHNTADNSNLISLVGNDGNISQNLALGSFEGWTPKSADNDFNNDGKADILWSHSNSQGQPDGVYFDMIIDATQASPWIGGTQVGGYQDWHLEEVQLASNVVPESLSALPGLTPFIIG